MASNKNKAVKTENEVTEEPESGTVSVDPVEAKRALFRTYDAADAELAAFEAGLDAIEQKRSDAVKAVAVAHGNGPFDWNGRHLSVTTRVKKVPAADGSGDIEVTRFYFKGSKKVVQVV